MNAEELRAFVREVLERLDDEPRTALEDSLIARAAKGRSGWKPAKPPSRLVTDVKGYAEAARRVGHAEAERVDAVLRQQRRRVRDPRLQRERIEAGRKPRVARYFNEKLRLHRALERHPVAGASPVSLFRWLPGRFSTRLHSHGASGQGVPRARRGVAP